jgi:hypothetical protein
MVKIDGPGEISEKWSRRAGQAQDDFQSGVEDSSDQEWEDGTASAVEAWEQGVNRALNDGTFESGVRNTEKSWQRRTSTLGPRRYSEGVRESEDEYQQGFEPFRQTIEDLDLPARGARGDVDTNIERARQVAQALTDERRS